MKKLLLSIITVLFVGFCFAQEPETPKTDKIYLPVAGEYAIGINPTPIINTVGNLIKINSAIPFASTAGFNSPDAANIYGKYFDSDKSAIRVRFRVGMTSYTEKQLVVDDVELLADATTDLKVQDKNSVSQTNVMIALGREKRIGDKRIQGLYGVEGIFFFQGNKTKTSYGNEFASTITTPTSYDFTIGAAGPAGARTLLNKNGSTLGIGARGFFGVEYFIMPKISLGGEFGVVAFTSMTGKGKVKTERWNGTTNKVEEIEVETGGESAFGIDNDFFIPGGTIALPSTILYLMFYF